MKQKQIYPKTEDILFLLKSGFIITSAFLAPGSLRREDSPKLVPPWEKYEKRYLKRKLRELKEEKLISFALENGKEIVKIAKEGEEKLKKLTINEFKIRRPAIWDKKWRIVIFDIPEKLKKTRDCFFLKLKDLGFKPIQDSVLVYPYPCYTEMNSIRELYGVKQYVRIMVVDEIEREGELKKTFNI